MRCTCASSMSVVCSMHWAMYFMLIARCHVVAKFIVVVYIGYSTRQAVVRALSRPEVCCMSP